MKFSDSFFYEHQKRLAVKSQQVENQADIPVWIDKRHIMVNAEYS